MKKNKERRKNKKIITKKMKKMYCLLFELFKPKLSYLLEKTLFLSIICKNEVKE